MSGVAATLLLAVGTATSLISAAAAHASPAPTAGSSAQKDVATAVTKARESGASVDIPSMTTPTETVTADPDGTFTLTESLHPVRVHTSGGSWTPIDTTLHIRADGTVAPAAVPSGMAFSGGGNTALATLTSAGKRLSVSWPTALPEPTISGSSATYADVFPDVDLTVTATALGGYNQVLVVKNADAAANPALATLNLPTTTIGLNVTNNAAGSLSAVDTTGTAYFTAPSASMWDSSAAQDGASAQTAQHSALLDDAAGAPAGEAPNPVTSSVDGAGTDALTAEVPATVSGGTIQLRPDTSVLRGSATRYPVYIDPSWNPVSAGGRKLAYDEVQQGCSDKNALNSTTAPYNTPGVGLNAYSGCEGIERAYYQMSVDSKLWTTAATPVSIVSATLKATEVYSASCAETGSVNAYLTGAISNGTTWSSPPGKSTLQDTQSFGPACTSNPSAGFDVSDAYTKASKSHLSQTTFGLFGTAESNALVFKRFSNNPTVTITYNTTPKVSSVSTTPPTACTGSKIGNTTVSLHATITDPDKGSPVYANFSLHNSAGATVKSVTNQGPVTQSGTVTWNVGSLASGTYTWTASATDLRNGSTAKTCSFIVDATAPPPPSVSSPDYAQDATDPRLPSGGEFDFSSNGATDVAKYAYNWGSAPPSINPPHTVTAATNGNASVQLTPTGLRDVLYVYAIDKSGNQSATQTYAFNQEAPTAESPAGDMTGDGQPDLVVPGPNGNLRLYQGLGGGQLSAPSLYASGSDFHGALLGSGDFDWDFVPDVVARQSDGNAYFYLGNGDATALATDTTSRTQLGLPEIPDDPQDPDSPLSQPFAWADVTQLVVAGGDQYGLTGDVDGDFNGPDVFVVTTDGNLWLLGAGSTAGMFGTAMPISTGWSGRTIVDAQSVGGYPALWVRDNATGELDLYTGNDTTPPGGDTSTKTVTAAAGWTTAAHPQLFSAGIDAHGNPQLWATDAQSLRHVSFYPAGSTAGTLGTGTWEQTLNPSDDFTGDGQADIAAEWGDGTLHMYTGEGEGQLTNGAQIWDSSWSSVTAMVSGDFNGDGTSDIVARWSDGTLHRYDGTGTGALKANVVLFGGSTSWNTVREVTAGDFTGDGSTDLVAVWNDGTLHLYTNNGQGVFSQPVNFWRDSTWSGLRLLSGGDFNGDGNGDILAVQTSTGDLRLYKGDGNGNLADGVVSGSLDWTGIKDIIPGDFSGDAKTDLAAIWGDGTLHLYTGNGAGGFTSTGAMWPDASWATVKLAT